MKKGRRGKKKSENSRDQKRDNRRSKRKKLENKNETRGKGTAMEIGVPKPRIRLGTRENEKSRTRPQKKGLQDYAYLTDVDETTAPKAPGTLICLAVTSRTQNLFNPLDQQELAHKDLEQY